MRFDKDDRHIDAVLINVARGEEVDEDALVAALSEGEIRGAVVDLHGWRHARALAAVRPDACAQRRAHAAQLGAGWETTDEGQRLIAENLRRFLAGEPLVNEVDRERGS